MDHIIAFLNIPLTRLKGVGEFRSAAFTRIGCSNFRDLLLHIPYTYRFRKKHFNRTAVQDGDLISTVVEVVSVEQKARRNGPVKIACNSHSGPIEIVYFNMPGKALLETFQVGRALAVSGAAKRFISQLEILHPEYVLHANEFEKIPSIEPVYNSTYGMNSKYIMQSVQSILSKLQQIDEYLPKEIMEQYNFMQLDRALRIIHEPKSDEDYRMIPEAKKRLAFEEILAHQIRLFEFRNKVTKLEKQPKQFNGDLYKKLIAQLPYRLTDSQNEVLEESLNDLKKATRAFRLIQGDVGCGKTVVALCLMLAAVESGFQAAIMVPTEILAIQHHKNIEKMLESLGLSSTLLISKLPTAGKKAALDDIRSGKGRIIIGTHALFQDSIEFESLGLVIIDEQHRFGVEQRKTLVKKGFDADTIMLSATPIPRTLEMVMYQDMDISSIKQMPANRKPIITSTHSQSKLYELISSIKLRLSSNKDERVYWVCPLIEESESMDLAHVKDRFEQLYTAFDKKVGVVHGKITPKEREDTMERFARGEISILVATTVIEVGVDVPSATLIIIENAERFGLAQLHQLRGRVGRGEKQSYCVLVYGDKISQTGKKRLNTMKESNDGFYIAEQDLLLRGAGEVTGIKQSGMPDFRIFNTDDHVPLLQASVKYCRDIFANRDIKAKSFLSYLYSRY
jgi:ATP-dependent DNA helicase RecG